MSETSETKVRHTPGPWVAVPMKTDTARALMHGGPPLFDDGIWWILPEADQERLPIAVIDRADDHSAPARAKSELDARLLAAAPELLKALEDISATAEHASCCANDTEWRLFLTVRIQEARAAIAKTTGQPA